MEKEHRELLDQIEDSEKSALALYRKGCRLDETIRLLRLAGNQIRDRLAHYAREAAGQKQKGPDRRPIGENQKNDAPADDAGARPPVEDAKR